jgi:serine/threonine-protein kinase
VAGDEDTREAVVHALLAQVAADAAAGRRRSDTDYVALFPEHAELVLEELRALAAEEVAAPAPAAGEPRRIGPYELIRVLGRGGQATVHLAHDPRLGRPVALKVLSRQFASVAQELRLQREATMAARIDDSGICPVHEVGRDGEHLFLAMKYVAGESLAQRLDAARRQLAGGEHGSRVRMPVAEVLQRFERLAGSLQRAHDQGVVHRDLKPANIMLGADEVPVLLDFGLAIAVDDDEPLTRTGDVFGTPQYLSPERLRLRTHRGDARDDLWALAVTLYEALTLQRPFDGATPEQLYRAILQDEPLPPSRHVRELPRDLDAVFAACFDKDPARRYRTAADFAADLRAVRLGEAIRARPPGPWRRAVRWHHRHAAAATAGWLVLAGFVSTVTVQQSSLAEVRAAQAETQGINTFLVEKLLLAVTPEQARGNEISVAQVFDQAQRNVDASFPAPTRTAGALHHVLGLANKGLGRMPQARANMERAVAVRREVLGPDAPETMASTRELAELRRATDDVAGAALLVAELLPRQRALLGPRHPDTLATMQEEVRAAMAQGQLEAAERLAHASLAEHRAALGDDDRATLGAQHLLARVLERRGERTAAEPLMRDVLERRRRTLGDDAPATVASMNDLASLLHDMVAQDQLTDRLAEAERLYDASLALAERLHGESSQAYATALNNFASFLHFAGRRAVDISKVQRAAELFRKSLALREAIDGAESSRLATAVANLGGVLLDLEQRDEAINALGKALMMREKLGGRHHVDTIQAGVSLMVGLLRCGMRKEALSLQAELARRLDQATEVPAKVAVSQRAQMLVVRAFAGEHEQALAEVPALYAECLRLWPGSGGAAARDVAQAGFTACTKLGRDDEAQVWRERLTGVAR